MRENKIILKKTSLNPFILDNIERYQRGQTIIDNLQAAINSINTISGDAKFQEELGLIELCSKGFFSEFLYKSTEDLISTRFSLEILQESIRKNLAEIISVEPSRITGFMLLTEDIYITYKN